MRRIIGVAVLYLAGCGGGSSCTPQADVHVQLFGDSTQAGWSTEPDGSSHIVVDPAVLLQAALVARFGPGITVENRGVSGTTAVELLAGTDGWNAPWPGSVAADVVVINHGINDMQAADLAVYPATLRALSKAPAVVIFETPNAIRNAPQFDEAPYAKAMKQVAAEQGVAVADTYTYTLGKTDLLSDWAHPTPALYTMISTNSVEPKVAAAVARLRCD